jgi:uncharacterized membrane protein YkgB
MKEFKADSALAASCRRLGVPLARAAILVVYAWFGALKIFGMSPANPLVQQLLERTLPFISFERFILLLGAYEIAIGIAFAIPGLERLAFALVVPHLFMTAGPLVFLPSVAWQAFLVPTLEGQYIIKNIVLIGAAMVVGATVRGGRLVPEPPATAPGSGIVRP